jgi:glycine/D-amino acid oxidase-like deaminating enzyme
MAQNTARVAVVGPLSGPRAPWGRLLTEAAAALPHGRVGWEMFDDQGDAALGATRAREIVSDGGFAAVAGHFNSLGARAALPLYRRAGLPVLLPLATAPGLGDDGCGLVLRFCPDDDAQAAAIIRACGNRRLPRIGVAHDGSGYGAGLAERVLAAAAGHVPAEPLRWLDEPARAVPLAPDMPVVACGVHHAIARLLLRRAADAALVIVPDDCDVPDFAARTAGSGAEILVARLAGGPLTRVVAAFAALAAALDKHPELRGSRLLEAVRGEAAEGFSAPGPGWEVVPVRAVAQGRAGLRHGATARAPHGGRKRAAGRFDVAVVGAGVVGRTTAAELAERGARVALLDAGPASSASAVSGALIRAYDHEQPQRRLAVRATQLLWGRDDLAARHGFRRTGSLVLLGRQHLTEAAIGVAELRAAGIRADLLSADEVADRWPDINGDGIDGAVWEPGAGYAVTAVTLAALLDRVRRAGVAVLHRRVRELTADGLISRGVPPLRAVVVVVAAGCGSAAVLAARWPTGRPPRTRRITYAIVDGGGRRLPSFADLTTGMWGRPDGRRGFLIGRPTQEWQVPVLAGRDLSRAQLDWIRTGVRRRLPFVGTADVLTTRFGTDLYLPGGPLLGVLGGAPPTVVAAGWSGGGFKTATAAAEHSASAALNLLSAAPAHAAVPLAPIGSV